jgi:hypothetical protein
VRDFGVSSFEQGNFQLVDSKWPQSSVRVDARTSDDVMVRSTTNRRKNFNHNGRWIDGVQRIATEGAMLTVIAKVSFETD